MPWLKAGDNAATHPAVLRVGSQGGSTNEVFGFVMRCALQSAGHTTDYIVDRGTAMLVGEGNHDRLLREAVKAGLMKACRHEGMRAWRLIDDPDFLHIRLRKEIDWERQQRADSSNPALTAPVRLRDGDACRYCGAVVSWAARKGPRRGSYDHRVPGEAATVDTLVVACGQCNSGRRDDPHADDRYPLRPVPLSPYYSEPTRKFLASQGLSVVANEQRPGITPDTALRSTQQPAGHRSATSSAEETPRHDEGSADFSGSTAHLPGRDGSGPGEVTDAGTGVAEPETATADLPEPRNPRRRRSRRGRPR